MKYIRLGILFQKIGTRKGYVFEASMARPQPKSGLVHPRDIDLFKDLNPALIKSNSTELRPLNAMHLGLMPLGAIFSVIVYYQTSAKKRKGLINKAQKGKRKIFELRMRHFHSKICEMQGYLFCSIMLIIIYYQTSAKKRKALINKAHRVKKNL